MGLYASKDVSDVDEGRYQEHLLYAFVLTLDHDQPDDYGANRHGYITGKPEQFEAGGDADKFRHHVAEVGDQNADHHQKRYAQPKLFADQVAEPFAGHRAHAGAHLL